MQQAGLDQLNIWRPERVQTYTAALWEAVSDDLADVGIQLPPQRGTSPGGRKVTRSSTDR